MPYAVIGTAMGILTGIIAAQEGRQVYHHAASSSAGASGGAANQLDAGTAPPVSLSMAKARSSEGRMDFDTSRDTMLGSTEIERAKALWLIFLEDRCSARVMMPDQLHIMQQMVKPNNAHDAIVVKSSALHTAHMNLVSIREQRGLTQRDLADMIGMDASTVNRAEKAAASAKLRTYQKCADALGVTLSDIFAEPLTSEERALLSKFRGIPDANHDMVQRFLEQVQASAAPRVPQTEPSDQVSTSSPAK